MLDISSYDATTGDGRNALQDAFKQLSKVCRNKVLRKVEVCVLLWVRGHKPHQARPCAHADTSLTARNKCDLLKQKIGKGQPLSRYFPDYSRVSSPRQGAQAHDGQPEC